MRLLAFNAGYFLQLRRIRDYVLHPQRPVIGSAAAESAALQQVVDLIQEEEPDVVSLLEVDQGSIRTRTDGQTAYIADALNANGRSYTWQSDLKYDPTTLRARLPIWRHMSNGALAQDTADIHAHYLGNGFKQLVHEIRYDGISVFAVHMPIVPWSRRRQISALADLVQDREQVVVCGDFNCYRGTTEVQPLTDIGLEPATPGPSYPGTTPRFPLDFFLHSPDLTVDRCDTVSLTVSDHLPIILETVQQ